MAAQPAPTTTAKYVMLSELYLALWKQLDLASNDAKWLEIRPEAPSAVSEEVRRRIASLGPGLSESDLNTARKDFEKTNEFVLSGLRAERGELVSFREYLRDLALRYSELANDD
jgi:hypothetical protein